ncbi:MAG: ABC transporter permease [Ignavibacteriales bacterium]|nr:ABC transporter permease [Ignavibacteriales bacterium]
MPLDRMKSWLKNLGPVIGLVFVFALFAILTPGKFATPGNFQLMLLQTAVVGTAALGMTMVIISGGIDLSVGSVIALTTVIVALLLNSGASPLVAAMGGVLAGMICGSMIGLLITQVRLAPFIVTLGMWGALRGAAKGLAGEQMIVTPGTWLTKLLNTHIFAVGSNEVAARICGVSVERTKMMVYILGSGFAALAGVLQYSYLTVGDPTTASGMELDIIAAVVIGGGSLAGGEGSIMGSLVGALIMTTVANGCTKMELPNWVQEIVAGAIIVIAVSLDRFRHRKRSE